jgi:CheY-like chemotaxis protein
MQASKTVAHADYELRARLTSNTPRPAIGKHVLIAGVFDMNNQLFKQLVELQGCTSMIRDDGEEGFQAAVKSRPDLIIVDAMGSAGFKLAQLLKGDDRTRHIPLIVISSHKEDAIIAAGHDVYDEFVAKPIRVLDLLKLVDKWLLPTQTATLSRGQCRGVNVSTSISPRSKSILSS